MSTIRGEKDFEGLDLEVRPDTVDRRCTDVHHAFVFLAFCALWLACVVRVLQFGDVRKLKSLQDGNGHHCQFNGPTPFLFFCKNASNGSLFDMRWPICREFCPENASTNSSVGALECGSPDYPTIPQMGILCEATTSALPVDEFQSRALASFVELAESIVLLKIVIERWQSLIVCSLIAAAASYFMLYILESNAGFLVRLGLIALTSATLLCGCYLLHGFRFVGLVPTEHETVNRIAGVCLLIASLVSFCIMARMSSAVETATDCIELACKCVMQTPSLTLHPVLMFIGHFATNVVACAAVLAILSCNREELVGNRVGFALNTLSKCTLAYVIFMWFWFHQYIYATSAFVTSYASALWYFNHGNQEGLPTFLLCRAYWVAGRYHFGTIAVGAFVVGLSTPVRMVLGMLVSWTSLKGNCVARTFKHCCCCLGDLFEVLNPLSKNAFIEVAMCARPFYSAAQGAEALVKRSSDSVRILNGATWVFQFVGLVIIGGLGALAMLTYTTQVVGDDYRVVCFMSAAGAIISVSTAMPFALIFDTVADTIFYCSEIEELQQRQTKKTSPHRSWSLHLSFQGRTTLGCFW